MYMYCRTSTFTMYSCKELCLLTLLCHPSLWKWQLRCELSRNFNLKKLHNFPQLSLCVCSGVHMLVHVCACQWLINNTLVTNHFCSGRCRILFCIYCSFEQICIQFNSQACLEVWDTLLCVEISHCYSSMSTSFTVFTNSYQHFPTYFWARLLCCRLHIALLLLCNYILLLLKVKSELFFNVVLC
jgi:hypothetical protein